YFLAPAVSLSVTAVTPVTFLAAFSASAFCPSLGTLPLSVTAPFLASTVTWLTSTLLVISSFITLLLITASGLGAVGGIAAVGAAPGGAPGGPPAGETPDGGVPDGPVGASACLLVHPARERATVTQSSQGAGLTHEARWRCMRFLLKG